MSRVRRFIRLQRVAWLALFGWMRKPVTLDIEPSLSGHPSDLCRCYDGRPAGPHSDHLPECQWLAVMCQTCSGTGWCQTCGGDGVDPTEESRAA